MFSDPHLLIGGYIGVCVCIIYITINVCVNVYMYTHTHTRRAHSFLLSFLPSGFPHFRASNVRCRVAFVLVR